MGGGHRRDGGGRRRITSYNVCYTKLLRLAQPGQKVKVEIYQAMLSAQGSAALLSGEFMEGELEGSVITSYSIHYTKLYDYLREEDGKRKRASDHPLYDLIHNQPNKKDTAFEFYEQGMGCLGLRGNQYSLIDRDGAGYITELIPVNPDKVQVLKGQDGLPYYRLLDVNEVLPMRMVHHIKAFSLDGFMGLSPIQTNADVIGLSLATEEHAARVFANGTRITSYNVCYTKLLRSCSSATEKALRRPEWRSTNLFRKASTLT